MCVWQVFHQYWCWTTCQISNWDQHLNTTWCFIFSRSYHMSLHQITNEKAFIFKTRFIALPVVPLIYGRYPYIYWPICTYTDLYVHIMSQSSPAAYLYINDLHLIVDSHSPISHHNNQSSFTDHQISLHVSLTVTISISLTRVETILTLSQYPCTANMAAK